MPIWSTCRIFTSLVYQYDSDTVYADRLSIDMTKGCFGSFFIWYNFGMGRTHKQQLALKKEIEAAKTKVTIGAQYWHYKDRDKVYEIIGVGFLEATDELCVIYQAQYGERLTFLRPLTSWLEQVAWAGQTLPRFTKIQATPD